MSASWIKKLNESDSRLYKEDVISQALEAATLGSINAKTFLGLCVATYNPFVTFGIKQVPTTVGIVDAENPWEEFSGLLTQLYKRELTGNAARDAIEAMSERFDSEEWNTFCAAVVRRDLRAGVSEKTFNKVCKKTEYEIPTFGCQLATNCENRPEMAGINRLEPKLDGCRVLMVVTPGVTNPSTVCYSRNGKEFENFSHIQEQIEKNYFNLIRASTRHSRDLNYGFVLDGEVISNTFQDLMRQARRKENVQANDSVFKVFDVIPLEDFRRGFYNANLANRVKILESMRSVFDTMPNVDLLPHIMVDLDTGAGVDQFKRYCKDMVNNGFEGVMIKNVEAPYECKRNTFWMKYKPVYDYDLTVINIEEGTGKNKNRMGALVCEGVDDNKHITVNVGSGYTDDERQSYWDNKDSVIGQTAVVIADAVTKNQDGTYSLRFPRFKCFRTDK